MDREAIVRESRLDSQVVVASKTWTCYDAGQGFPGWAQNILDEYSHPSELIKLIRTEGGNFRDDLKSRTPRRSDVDFDTATQRPLGGNDRG
jgi:hypothetical protein